MRKVFIAVITFYSRFISPLLHQLLGTKTVCRNTPTCSVYAQGAIAKYGIGKGLVLSLRRFLNCQPFFSI